MFILGSTVMRMHNHCLTTVKHVDKLIHEDLTSLRHFPMPLPASALVQCGNLLVCEALLPLAGLWGRQHITHLSVNALTM